MNTGVESASRNRRDADPSESLIANTAASRNDLIELAPPELARCRQVGGVVFTREQDEPIQAVKYVYVVAHTSDHGTTLLWEADEDAVGIPGGTAASLVSWPEMWTHPERTEPLPNQLISSSVSESGETPSWDGFIHGFIALTISNELPAKRFRELLDAWRADIELLSNTNEICTHPAYQQIIGMGALALPFIFGEMQKEVGPWFWALKAITGADPVPEDDHGRVRKMTQHWLDWAKRQGYV